MEQNNKKSMGEYIKVQKAIAEMIENNLLALDAAIKNAMYSEDIRAEIWKSAEPNKGKYYKIAEIIAKYSDAWKQESTKNSKEKPISEPLEQIKEFK